MSQTNQISPEEKNSLKAFADEHIARVAAQIQTEIDRLDQRAKDERENAPELGDLSPSDVAAGTAAQEYIFAKIKLYEEMTADLKVVQNNPYFIKMEVRWEDTGKQETFYFSKFQYKDEGIYSWLAPISSLRFGEVGQIQTYEKPDKNKRSAQVLMKQNYIIVDRDIVFMAHEDEEHPRQIVFQKHLSERRSFMLPEIVSQLDQLQDQIIRSDPHGSFLISGPAGSGKTTLALHRVAYLVLTPEFQDYFNPRRITIFVADDGAVTYFSKLLPELGINGVRITTFNDWALMIANSRFRAKLNNRFRFQKIKDAVEFIAENNPFPELHPRLVLDEYRKHKQLMITSLNLREGSQKDVYPALQSLYVGETKGVDERLIAGLTKYLSYQKKNKLLDEVDLIILLNSLEYPTAPFVHIVVDEVQNWLPEQLQYVKDLATRDYRSITFIGDIRQKTKTFAIQSWNEISEEFDNDVRNKVELLKVYRNTKEVLEYLQSKGFNIDSDNARQGKEVVELKTQNTKLEVMNLISEIEQRKGKVQIGIVAKYQTSLQDFEYLTYESEHIHVLTIEEAQGLEFECVILVDAHELERDRSAYNGKVAGYHAQEFAEQNRHLFYVAVTRAREELYVLRSLS